MLYKNTIYNRKNNYNLKVKEMTSIELYNNNLYEIKI